MFRQILPAICVALLAAPLAAQDKPSADDQKAMIGTWTFDPSHSDTVNARTLRELRGAGGFRSGAGAGAGASSGGKGGKGGHAAPAAAAPAATDADSAATAQRDSAFTAMALGDPHTSLVIADMMPGARLMIATNDSAVTLADAQGRTSSFRTDGRKREQAQMDGSIIETQALWKNGTLEITRGVVGSATLTRDFKPSKDGQSLELKETIEAGSGKVQKKLMFVRQ